MASNLRRFFLQTDELEEPAVPFVVVIETKYLTTASNRRHLSFQNLPSHMRDVLYVFCFLCHKFDGKIYTVYNEPFLSQEQGVLLSPHQRAMVSTSVSFVFLMSRKRLCEAQDPQDPEGPDGEASSSCSVPFWMRGADGGGMDDERSNGAFSLTNYDLGGGGDDFFLPTQAHRRLTNAVLDLLAVKMGVACFAHVSVGDLKAATRAKIDFFQCAAQGLSRADVKAMGGSFFLTGERVGGLGGGGSSRTALPGLASESLDALLDALDDFASRHVRTERGRVQIRLSRRNLCDANTALWLKLKQFLAMHVWEGAVFKRYARQTARRFAMSLGLDPPGLDRAGREELEALPELAPMFERGTLRLMRELSAGNSLRRLTAPQPVDVLAFEYKPHELLKGGALEGALQAVPAIDFGSFEIQSAIKQRYGLDDVSRVQRDASLETYASIVTDYAVFESLGRSAAQAAHIYNCNSSEYYATLWPHLYCMRTMIETQAVSRGLATTNYLRLRNEVPMLDSIWSLGLNKASAVMNQLFNLYKKLMHRHGQNYGRALAFEAADAASLARWRCADPPVAAYASLVVKLFGSHVYVSRLLQAELMLKLMAAATAPRWRTSRTMVVNYTPTAHGKTLCNQVVALLFKNIDGLLLRKASFTPASLKYESEHEVGGAGCTIVFDDANVAGISGKNANDEVSNISTLLKNVLDTSVAVSNIAGTLQAPGGGNNSNNRGGDYRSKTVTAVHNVQWVWNVNSLSTFSTAVLDRSLVVAQQQQPKELTRVPDNPATVISQAGVYGDKQDEETIVEARLQPLAELWLTRLHVHLSLVGVLAPQLAAPASDERSFLYGLLAYHMRHVFHLSSQVADPDKKETNRGVDKATDVCALTAHAMAAFHVFDTAVPPFAPLRYPKRHERLSDYLRAARALAHKASSYRTREDTVLDTMCAAVLYTGPALLDAFSQVHVQVQGMHLSALAAVVRHVKGSKLFQWTVGADRISVTVPRGVLTGYYQFDENCAQLYELKKCMLGAPSRAPEQLVEGITVHRTESNAIESIAFDFATAPFYRVAAHLFADEHAAFEAWYDEQAGELEAAEEAATREVDASSAPYFHIMFAQLRQALGYGVRFQPAERTGEHTVLFVSPCKFWWSRFARDAAREALRDPATCRADRAGFLARPDGAGPVFDAAKWGGRAATFPQPFALHAVNREPNVKRTPQHVFVHWKCLGTELLAQLDAAGAEPLYEDNYYGVPATPQNSAAVEPLERGRPRALARNKFRGSAGAPAAGSAGGGKGEVVMWEDERLALLAAFVDPAVRPARVFSDSFPVDSGFAHYCAPRTFCFTNKEEKRVLTLGDDERVPYKPHVVFQKDPSRQGATFTRLGENFFELKRDWEYVRMAEVFQNATARTDVTAEDMRDWHSVHWPTGVSGAPPASYPDFCRDMKTPPDLDAELASAHLPEQHPVFERMRRFYGAARAQRWLSGEEMVDWNVVHAAVKRHYNHGAALEASPLRAEGREDEDEDGGGQGQGLFTFVREHEHAASSSSSSEPSTPRRRASTSAAASPKRPCPSGPVSFADSFLSD